MAAGCLLLVDVGQDLPREHPDKIAKITTSELPQCLLLDSEEAFLRVDDSLGTIGSSTASSAT